MFLKHLNLEVVLNLIFGIIFGANFIMLVQKGNLDAGLWVFYTSCFYILLLLTQNLVNFYRKLTNDMHDNLVEMTTFASDAAKSARSLADDNSRIADERDRALAKYLDLLNPEVEKEMKRRKSNKTK